MAVYLVRNVLVVIKMSKDEETIFKEESSEGVLDDKYRIVIMSSPFLLQGRVNEIVEAGKWDIVGAAFESTAGWCQTMARLPKTKLMRQSLG